MLRRLVILLACAVTAPSFAQGSQSALYGDLERIYSNVLTAHLFAVTANSLTGVVRLNEAGAARTGDNGSLLHAAALFADPPMLEYLVSIGFGMEEWGGAGGSALFVAVSEDRRENVEWLIEHGADVNATGVGGVGVLRYSLVCRRQELVDYLLAAGAVPDQKSIELADRLGLVLRAR